MVLLKSLFHPWKWLIAFTMLIALWLSVDSLVSWRATLSVWCELSLFGLIFAFLLFLCSHLLRALRMQIYVFKDVTGREPVKFLAVAKLSAIHQFSNNLLPMRLGELVFPLLAKRYFGGSWQARFSQLFWLRVLDALFFAVVLIILAAKVMLERLSFDAWVFVLLFGALCAVFLWVVLKHGCRYFNQRGWLKVITLNTLYRTIKCHAPADTSALRRIIVCTILAWVCKLSALAVVVQLLSQLSITTAIFGTLFAEISSLLPVHGVAGVGSFEAAFVGGSVLTRTWDVQLIAIAVNVHLFVFLSTSIITLVLLPFNIRRSSVEVVNV